MFIGNQLNVGTNPYLGISALGDIFKLLMNYFMTSARYGLLSPRNMAAPTPTTASNSQPFSLLDQMMSTRGRSQIATQPSASTVGRSAANPTDTTNTGGQVASDMGIMDLTPFKLRLPTGREGSPDGVEGSKLSTYKSKYFSMENGVMRMWSPVTGATTANSDHTRSELAQEQGWKMNSGEHSFSVSMKITDLPSNGKMTIGQIHQRGPERPPVMLRYDNGKIAVSVMETNASNAKRKEYVIAEGVGIGDAINYKFQMSPNGELTATVNGKTQKIKMDDSFNKGELYFKAGVYLGDNEGPPTEGGGVEISGMQMS